MPPANAVAQPRGSAGSLMPEDFDHFERRLVEELSKLRLQIAELRTDMRGELGAIRTEMAVSLGSVRADMAVSLGSVRADMAGVRTEMAVNRFELLKWAFAFWVGQLVGVAGIVGLLLRLMPGR